MHSSRAVRADLADVFAHCGVAEAYQHRPPYPEEVFTILEQLITDRPRHVLDLGAGEGALARPLAALVDHIDAVDISAAMVAAGRRRPGGQRDNLRWIVAAAETWDLQGPYALVIAGASLHWMSWKPLMTRLAGAMTDHAFLAIVEHGARNVAWKEELLKIIVRHSRNPDFDPRYCLVDALREEGYFDLVGRAETAAMPFLQPIESYVEQFHSTATLAREHMSKEEAVAFDQAIEQAVRPWAVNGILQMQVVATLAWGHPRLPTTQPPHGPACGLITGPL